MSWEKLILISLNGVLQVEMCLVISIAQHILGGKGVLRAEKMMSLLSYTLQLYLVI